MSDDTATAALFPALTLTTFGITDRGIVRETNAAPRVRARVADRLSQWHGRR